MKTVVGFCEFQDAFRDAGRGNSFSYYGLKALYEYLTQLEEDCGMEIELDVIAFDCEYTEYSDIKEAYEVYKDDFDELDDEEDKKDELAAEYLNDRTTIISFDGGIIIQNF